MRLSTSSTSSFVPACACSSKTTSPVVQFLARNPRTYWLPRLGDRPFQDGGAPVSFAHVLGELRRQRRISGLPHQPQLLPDALVRDEAEEWRLPELH